MGNFWSPNRRIDKHCWTKSRKWFLLFVWRFCSLNSLTSQIAGLLQPRSISIWKAGVPSWILVTKSIHVEIKTTFSPRIFITIDQKIIQWRSALPAVTWRRQYKPFGHSPHNSAFYPQIGHSPHTFVLVALSEWQVPTSPPKSPISSQASADEGGKIGK